MLLNVYISEIFFVLFKQERTWQVKARDGEVYTLKLIKHGFVKEDEEFLTYTGKIFARSFAQIYPEAGAKKYLVKHQLGKPTDDIQDIKELSEERRQRLVKLIKEHRKELVEYAQEYLVADFRSGRLLPFKEFIKKGELVSFVLFKEDKPVGFALFTDSFIHDGAIIPVEKGTKVLKILAVDPVIQGKGLSKHLIFSILRLFPKTKKIRLSTGIAPDIVTGQRKHEKAYQVYSRYGFKPYVEDRVKYDPDEKQFFVWDNPAVK